MARDLLGVRHDLPLSNTALRSREERRPLPPRGPVATENPMTARRAASEGTRLEGARREGTRPERTRPDRAEEPQL